MILFTCETFVTTGLVVVGGEVSTNAYVDIEEVVRNTIKKIGYTKAEYKFDSESCGVLNAIHAQSPDIAVSKYVTVTIEWFQN